MKLKSIRKIAMVMCILCSISSVYHAIPITRGVKDTEI